MKIRLATLEDAAACAEIYAPFVRDTYVTFEEEAPDASEMAARIEKTLRTHPWLALDEDGQTVGYAYGSVNRDRAAYRWGVDTTVYLGPKGRGRGHGRHLYEALLPLLKAQGFTSAYAGIALPNEASVRLHESFGFRSIALYSGAGYKAGAWHDVGWWAMDLNPRENPPAEPIPFSELDSVINDQVLDDINQKLR